MNQVDIARKMLNCDITNGYEGLDELERFATVEPESAWGIILKILTQGADPGKDDGAMCLELLRIASSCLDRPSLENHLLDVWGSTTSEIRRNLIHGFADSNVVSLSFAVAIFDHPQSTVRERHLILATLASCRHIEAKQVILSMAGRIGQYEDTNRQDKLEVFVKSVISSY